MKVIQTCKVKDYLLIDKIELHPENPRTISSDRMKDLKASIVEKGFYEPILVWKTTNYVLSGNHRLKAVRELIREGWKFGSGSTLGKLPVVLVDENNEVARQILFETNNRYAEWIDEKVREALTEANSESIKGFGFTDSEVDLYLSRAIKSANDALEQSRDDLKFDEDEDEEIKPVSDDDLKLMVKNANVGVVFNKSMIKQIERRVDLLRQFDIEDVEDVARGLVVESLEDECDEDIIDRYKAQQAE